jgi:hypothetical protein
LCQYTEGGDAAEDEKLSRAYLQACVLRWNGMSSPAKLAEVVTRLAVTYIQLGMSARDHFHDSVLIGSFHTSIIVGSEYLGEQRAIDGKKSPTPSDAGRLTSTYMYCQA